MIGNIDYRLITTGTLFNTSHCIVGWINQQPIATILKVFMVKIIKHCRIFLMAGDWMWDVAFAQLKCI